MEELKEQFEGCPCCKGIPAGQKGRHWRRRMQKFLAQMAKEEVPIPLRITPGLVQAADGGVMVNTVLGPVSSAALGRISGHEHLAVGSTQFFQQYPELFPRADVIKEASEKLAAFKAEGGGAIIDCTTFDLGRDINLLREVSEKSGVHVLAVTGTWTDIPRIYTAHDPEKLADIFVRECMVGIEGTGIKANIIKCAHQLGPGDNDMTWRKGTFTRAGEITARACAKAAIRTGLPITTHAPAVFSRKTGNPKVGLEQIRIFKEEGVNLNRVYIGHSFDDVEGYLIPMLKEGVWLGIDTFPLEGGASGTPGQNSPRISTQGLSAWEHKIQVVKQLVDAGFGHRICIAHDFATYFGIFDEKERAATNAGNPDGYCHIYRKVLPRLQELGLTKEQCEALVHGNPRRYLENKP